MISVNLPHGHRTFSECLMYVQITSNVQGIELF